ncbi:hypothetical protein HanPSC8_Chr05g0196181 [Helianthus annuus]|nr:hypothetical protein HanPSC8_Chr05g0196181 [Helianthus annuus]
MSKGPIFQFHVNAAGLVYFGGPQNDSAHDSLIWLPNVLPSKYNVVAAVCFRWAWPHLSPNKITRTLTRRALRRAGGIKTRRTDVSN